MQDGPGTYPFTLLTGGLSAQLLHCNTPRPQPQGMISYPLHCRPLQTYLEQNESPGLQHWGVKPLLGFNYMTAMHACSHPQPPNCTLNFNA
jgi:hypothetical protein